MTLGCILVWKKMYSTENVLCQWYFLPNFRSISKCFVIHITKAALAEPATSFVGNLYGVLSYYEYIFNLKRFFGNNILCYIKHTYKISNYRTNASKSKQKLRIQQQYLTPSLELSGGLISANKYLKNASRWSPLRWKILRILRSWRLFIIAWASSKVAFSSFWTSIKNRCRFSALITPLSEYRLNKFFTSAGASAATTRNRRRKQKQTLYVCFDIIIRRKTENGKWKTERMICREEKWYLFILWTVNYNGFSLLFCLWRREGIRINDFRICLVRRKIFFSR